MASTSLVFSFRAMTVGSLRTIPRPRAYTSVLAVPRSMARSLASPMLLPRVGRVAADLPPPLGGQGLQLPVESIDPGLHRRGLAVAEEDHQPSDHAHHDDGDEEQQVRHQFAAQSSIARSSISRSAISRMAISRTSWAAAAQSLPSSQVSFFQIGTVS